MEKNNQKDNVYKFKKRSSAVRKKSIIRILAIIGALLMLTSVIGSLIYYL